MFCLHHVQVMSVKALGTALKLTFEGNNQLLYPETWFFVFIVATCVITQMNYLNKVRNVEILLFVYTNKLNVLIFPKVCFCINHVPSFLHCSPFLLDLLCSVLLTFWCLFSMFCIACFSDIVLKSLQKVKLACALNSTCCWTYGMTQCTF